MCCGEWIVFWPLILIWYASPVWDPYLQKDVNLLEKIQQFACNLLYQLQLPTLANSKFHMRLGNMNETIHGLLYFPPDFICPRVTMPHNIRSHLLYQPYACINAYFDYYVPSTISHRCQRCEWLNDWLPEHLCLRWQWLSRGVGMAPTYLHHSSRTERKGWGHQMHLHQNILML